MKKLLLLSMIQISVLFPSFATDLSTYGQTLENYISMTVNESIIIQLPAAACAGPDYTWHLRILTADPIIKLEKDSIVNGTHHFQIKAIEKGTIFIRFVRWNEEFIYHINIE